MSVFFTVLVVGAVAVLLIAGVALKRKEKTEDTGPAEKLRQG